MAAPAERPATDGKPEDSPPLLLPRRLAPGSAGASAHRLKHTGPKPEAEAKAEPEAAGRRPKTLLLVEDVRVTQKVATVALSRAKYKVELASDGLNAVETYIQSPFDIILMDIQLPKMDGIEATRRIREWEQQNKKPAAVIFGLTSSVSDEDLERYKSAGMNGCIAKGKILVEAVKEALDEHYAAPERFVIARLSVGGAT